MLAILKNGVKDMDRIGIQFTQKHVKIYFGASRKATLVKYMKDVSQTKSTKIEGPGEK